jgi:hypothetical protein
LVLLWSCSLLTGAENSWSADLLREVLETKGRANHQAATGAGRDGAQAEGLILKSYQLRQLRMAETARGKSALALLTKLLPAGSSLKLDAQSNTLHLLASKAAHAAAWDFISTLDVPAESPGVTSQDLSPTLQELLRKLEQAQGGTARLAETVDRMQQELRQDREGRVDENRRKQYWLWPGLGGLILLLGVLAWKTRRSGKTRMPSLENPETGLSLSAHELLGTQAAGSRQQRELQQEMLGAINAAAIRMEAWYKEQQAQRDQLTQVVLGQELTLRQAQQAFSEAKEQLLHENRALLEKAGSRFESSAGRMEENLQQLGRQHERVEALAGELQSTVQELDQTKDEILRLQTVLQQRGDELEKARERLNSRETELTHQQAKLAALTLILEEGSWAEGRAAERSEPIQAQPAPFPAEKAGTERDSSRPAPLQPASLAAEGRDAASREKQTLCTTTPPQPLYQFLPPNHPET